MLYCSVGVLSAAVFLIAFWRPWVDRGCPCCGPFRRRPLAIGLAPAFEQGASQQVKDSW
jgi:hypothetical protein